MTYNLNDMHDIGFVLKKFVSFFVEPFGIVTTLLVFGLYFLYMKKEKRAKLFLFGSLFSLLLFSYPPFSNFLVKNLENQFHKYDYKQSVEYIHVLGNGHTTDNDQPISSQLSDAGIKRVVEGVVIHKKMPNSKLIFTGYKGLTNISNAQMNARLATALGVQKKDMIINGKPVDTKEEAIFTKSIVGDKPFLLVTSATHMPRAMLLFKQLGMHPIPAPTDFHQDHFYGWLRELNSESFFLSTIAMHEYIGLLWTKIRGESFTQEHIPL